MEKSKKLIAITGGIGSGKSFVLSTLKSQGYQTLSSDEIVTKLYKKRSVLKKVKALFPLAVKGVFAPTIDRKYLASEVFSCNEKRKALTDLVTPLVYDYIISYSKKVTGKLFVEVPLLFETNKQNDFDNVIIIYRNLKDRIESVKTRSNLTEKEILARIASQVDYERIDKNNYIVLENDGDKETFTQKILTIASSI